MIRAALLSALLSLPLLAQTSTAPPAAAPLPVNHIDGGIFYNSVSSPAVTGWVSYAHQVSGGLYNIDFVDIVPALNSAGRFAPKLSTTGGLATPLTSAAGWQVYAVAAVGITAPLGGVSTTTVTNVAAKTTTTTTAPASVQPTGTTGFVALHQLKGPYTVDLVARVIAGSGAPQYVFGIGFGWGR